MIYAENKEEDKSGANLPDSMLTRIKKLEEALRFIAEDCPISQHANVAREALGLKVIK